MEISIFYGSVWWYKGVLHLGLLHNALGVGPERCVHHGAGGSGVCRPALRMEGAEGSERGVDTGGGQHYVATGACGMDLRPGSRQARSGPGGSESPSCKNLLNTTSTYSNVHHRPARGEDRRRRRRQLVYVAFLWGGGGLGQRQGEEER